MHDICCLKEDIGIRSGHTSIRKQVAEASCTCSFKSGSCELHCFPQIMYSVSQLTRHTIVLSRYFFISFRCSDADCIPRAMCTTAVQTANVCERSCNQPQPWFKGYRDTGADNTTTCKHATHICVKAMDGTAIGEQYHSERTRLPQHRSSCIPTQTGMYHRLEPVEWKAYLST